MTSAPLYCFQGEATLASLAPERSEPETSSGRRPDLPTDLPDDPVHVDDARSRHATPPVEHPVLVETYPHPRPDGRRALLVTALQNLLRLRVPVLYRNHSLSSQPRRRESKIPIPPVLFQSFACIADIGFTYICELVSTLRPFGLRLSAGANKLT